MNKQINESKSVGILYHYTSLENAIKIIKENQLKSNISDQGIQSISFTRNKNFHKNKNFNGISNECRFVIDGNKLSNKYKISPYAQKDFEKSSENFEAEERITSSHSFTIPINTFLVNIDVTVDKFKLLMDFKLYMQLFSLCKDNKIKISTMSNDGTPLPFIKVLNLINKLNEKN